MLHDDRFGSSPYPPGAGRAGFLSRAFEHSGGFVFRERAAPRLPKGRTEYSGRFRLRGATCSRQSTRGTQHPGGFLFRKSSLGGNENGGVERPGRSGDRKDQIAEKPRRSNAFRRSHTLVAARKGNPFEGDSSSGQEQSAGNREPAASAVPLFARRTGQGNVR